MHRVELKWYKGGKVEATVEGVDGLTMGMLEVGGRQAERVLMRERRERLAEIEEEKEKENE